MFEVGFSEIVLIMLIALVVLGPEKLPKLAADVGRWVGRARSMARQLRSQLDQEVQLDDMLRDKPSTPPPSYPPPNQTPSAYGAAGAAAATTAAAGATHADAATPPLDGSATQPDATATDTTDPVSAMEGAPRSREEAYAAHVAQTQAAYQNPPAVGPGAPDIGAPTDDAHSHGHEPAHAHGHSPAHEHEHDAAHSPPPAVVTPATPDPTDTDRAHGHRHS